MVTPTSRIRPRAAVITCAGLAAIGLVAPAACSSSSSPAAGPPATSATTAPAPVPGTSAPTSPSTTVAPASVTVAVYFLRGSYIGVAHRRIPATAAIGTGALQELVAGPDGAEQAAGLSTAVPSGSKILGLNVSG
ncbi:MAG TPA: hypothetical protein VFH70_10285, partial [Acidimicrobiales bacterium]|nr:hypothetical protein [Acidimicrobiales bacterium]